MTSDDEICAVGVELAKSVESSARPENRPRRLHRCSWRNIWTQHAIIRELILEIVLGTTFDSLEDHTKYDALISRYLDPC